VDANRLVLSVGVTGRVMGSVMDEEGGQGGIGTVIEGRHCRRARPASKRDEAEGEKREG